VITPDYEEVLDLVDENDQVVGTILHSEVFDEANLQGRYLRASNLFIINSEGKLWVPKRLATKKLAPNGLDYSAGEHVGSGESYVDAAVRGAAEELNLHIEPEDLELMFKTSPDPKVAPYFDTNFLYRSDDVPAYSPDDFQSWAWMSPEELLQQLDSGTPAKKSLRPAVALLLGYLAQHERNK
jgi:isopentenyl-diphosphate delta-isomerase